MKKISAQNMHDVANELRELLKDKQFALAMLYTEEPDVCPALWVPEEIDVDSNVRVDKDGISVFFSCFTLLLREEDEYWFGIDEVYLQTAEEHIVIEVM